MHTSANFHNASKFTKLPSYQMWQIPVHAKDLVLITNWLPYGKNSVIMNLFSIENVYLLPELTVVVIKWIFCYKEGILEKIMETDPFPAN